MSVIITDASGKIQNEINETDLNILEKLQIRIDKENKKIDLNNLGNTAFSITKFNANTKIIAHALGTSKIYARNTEYYFFYITDETKNLSNILNNFLIEVEKENEKNEIKLIVNKESLFLFRDIKNSFNKENTLNKNEDLIKAAYEFLEKKKQSILFETSNIEKVISFIIQLDEKCKILNYTIYNSTNVRFTEEPETVNFLFNREKSIGIEPSAKFKEFFLEYNLNNIFNNFVSAFDHVIESWNNLDNETKKAVFKIVYTNIQDFKNVLDNLIKWSESGKSGKYSNKLNLKDVSFVEKNQTNDEILSNYRTVIDIWEKMDFGDKKDIAKDIFSKVNKFCTELESFNKKSETIPEKINSQQDSDLSKPIILHIDTIFTKVIDIWEKLDSKQKQSIIEQFQEKYNKLNKIYNMDVKSEPFLEKMKKHGFVSGKIAGIISGMVIIFVLIEFYKYFEFPPIELIYIKYIIGFILIITLIILLHYTIKKMLPEQNHNSDYTANKPGNDFSNKSGVTEGQASKKIVNSIGMEFVLIPSGEFDMGSNNNEKVGDSNERPQHRVNFSKAFYMSIYTVTQKQWRDIMKSNPSSLSGDNYHNHPVEQISWNDVQEFIKKLNEKEHTNKYRLPSEAEWEYAARAGSRTGYFFGENESKLGEYAWYAENSGKRPPIKGDYFGYNEKDWEENKWKGNPHSVGQKKPNTWRLYDMHGNVWEWVQDKWHENYNEAPTDGSVWENGDILFRVGRGGGWANEAKSCRSAARVCYDPGKSYHIFGFRLVKEK